MTSIPFRLLSMAAVMALIAGAPAAADDADAPRRVDGMRLQLAQAAEPQVADPNDDINDPLEPVNRIFFTFNEGVQDAVLRPLAYTYNDVFPVTFRTGVRNFMVYLATPVTLANDLLQLEITRAMQTVSRFMVNTVGLVGIADLASELGMEGHREDFGQTLAVWGVGEGFYLVLPLLGPSNPRDAVGKYVVDSYFDPLGLYLDNTDQDALLYSRLLVDGFTQYAGLVRELDEIKKTSVDYYAALRSLYRQKRQAEIANGSPPSLPSIPDYDINLEPDVRSEPVAVAPAQ